MNDLSGAGVVLQAEASSVFYRDLCCDRLAYLIQGYHRFVDRVKVEVAFVSGMPAGRKVRLVCIQIEKHPFPHAAINAIAVN